MGTFRSTIVDHLVIGAQVRLTPGDEFRRRRDGEAVPSPIPIRLIIDTGAKRTTLLPEVINVLGLRGWEMIRVHTALGSGTSMLCWVRLEFPGTNLATLEAISVVPLMMPRSLRGYHGLLGRDILFRWESFQFQGRRRRFTIRDSLPWFGRWFS